MRPLLSLRRDARREVEQHLAINESTRSYRHNALTRSLCGIVQGKSGAWYLLTYLILLSVTFVIGHLSLEWLAAIAGEDGKTLFVIGEDRTPIAIDEWLDVNRVIAGAQATLLGVVLPVAIALVTLANNQYAASPYNTLSRAYFRSSGAYEIGRSSSLLLVTSVLMLFFPVSGLPTDSYATCADCLIASAVTLLNVIWFSANVIGLWFFLKISLDFARPEGQREFVRRFHVNVALPRELEDRLTGLRLSHPVHFNVITSDECGDSESSNFLVSFFGYSDIGRPEVTSHLNGDWTLNDVYFGPLLWVIRRWTRRSGGLANAAVANPSLRMMLCFPISIGSHARAEIIICRRRNGSPLTKFERWVVSKCFRFKRASV